MILGATHVQQQMGEGRRLQTATVNLSPIVEVPEMPPHYKVDNSNFNARGLPRQSPTTENIKTFLPQKDEALLHTPSHAHSLVTSNLPQPVSTTVSMSSPQPFTAPWLTDVARMTPLSFSSTAGSSVAEYYHHFHNIPPSTHLYSAQYPSQLPYVHDYSHSSGHPSPTPPSILIDSRARSEIPDSAANMQTLAPRSATPGSSSMYRGYPMDFRSQNTIPSHKEKFPVRSAHQKISPVNLNLSPKDHTGEPNTKKRPLYLPPPSSPLPPTSKSPTALKSYPSTSRRTHIPQPASSDASPNVPNPPASHSHSSNTPFHSHFSKGSLITLGKKICRVEDLRTSDFIDAANEASDLILDPSTVGAITSDAENFTSVITFRFPSTNKEIPVEASNDHPFFVFHKGWSSCNPESTMLKYDLKVRQLQLGDICVSLRKKTSSTDRPEIQSGSTEMPPPKTPPKNFSTLSTSSPVPSSSALPSTSCSSPSTCTSVISTQLSTLSYANNNRRPFSSNIVTSFRPNSLYNKRQYNSKQVHSRKFKSFHPMLERQAILAKREVKKPKQINSQTPAIEIKNFRLPEVC
ncbi:Ataxin-1 [Armadillidium vulgare]|nr:Ataxin-1 [Armadillidium vulgare]